MGSKDDAVTVGNVALSTAVKTVEKENKNSR